MSELWFCPNCNRKTEEDKKLIMKICKCGERMRIIKKKRREDEK